MRAALIPCLAVLLVFTSPARTGSDDPAAAALAQTERAFAQLCVEKGVRASFLTYFADDAIGFEPGPVKAKETMLARPAPATKPPYTLDWWPEVVVVAASGDFGWSTGPSHRTPDAGAEKAPPPNDGHYFSIWKKRADGTWKVALDIGIDCPLGSIAPRAAARLTRLPATARPSQVLSSRSELQSGITRAVAEGRSNTVLGRFTTDARFYADGQPLVSGDARARAALEKLPAPFHYEPFGVEVAATDDLAVTYGRLDFTDGAGKKASRWIVNVWQRDAASGIWQVAGAAYDAPFPASSK